MEKIVFVNNTQPYINATNLNAIQNNVENTINQTKAEINNKFVYSNDEKVVGEWFGKPLYRKDFKIEVGIGSESTYEFSHNIQNIDFIKIKEATIFNTSTKQSYSLPVTLYNSHSSTDNLSVTVNNTKITFYMQSGWSNVWVKYVSLEYTKTTD